MKTLMYRAMDKNHTQWYIGYYVRYHDRSAELDAHYIFFWEDNLHYLEIDENTLGRDTSLTDKHEFHIFEGDILRSYTEDGTVKYYAVSIQSSIYPTASENLGLVTPILSEINGQAKLLPRVSNTGVWDTSLMEIAGNIYESYLNDDIYY